MGEDFVIGVDVGGTFTDVVSSNGSDTWRAKAPTNPAVFSEGVLGATSLVAKQMGLSCDELLRNTRRFGLGTTAVTNVLATRRGARVGLLTTAGFEDHLHARNDRLGCDGWLVAPWLPVQRTFVRGINERIDRNGDILVPLNCDELLQTCKELIEVDGAQAIAISYLWSVRNPRHEAQTVEIIAQNWPSLPVFAGAALHPLLREYERTKLAVLSAFSASALDGIEELERELAQRGMECPLLLLHSGGGAMSTLEARANPLGLASSGPAAGAVAAAEFASAANYSDVVTCDMGGTSIDVAVIRDGVPERAQTISIQGITTSLSAVDVESIGAGGGSIAWIDSRGMLRVGPQSARATPGPVCYGRGGTEPTVTDAMVLLGYIDPSHFLGGTIQLDVEAARAACRALGSKINMNAIQVAHGIREVAIVEMGKAIRSRLASGGLDPRKMAMLAFGGSGALFATAIAKDIGLRAVLTPYAASVLSAFGAATADIRRDRSRAIDLILPLDTRGVQNLLGDLIQQVDAELDEHKVSRSARKLICEGELRFYRQKSSLRMQVDRDELYGDRLADRFCAAYAERYGKSGMTAESLIELSTLRVIGLGKILRASLPNEVDDAGSLESARIGTRKVYRSPAIQDDVLVFDMEKLRSGHVIDGPALIDAVDSTLWAPPASRVEVAGARSLVIHF